MLALPEVATAPSVRFVAQPPAHPLPTSGGCTLVVHREVTSAQSARERSERGARVDALIASRRTLAAPPEAAEAPGGGGALTDASMLPSTRSVTPPAEAQVVVQGELFDRLVAQEPPLAALPEDAALLAVASELYLLRVELLPADLLQLPVVVAEVITAFPFSALQHGVGATTPRLVGLQFAATPPVPAVVALVRGNPHSLMSASWRSAHPAFGSSTARLAEPADISSFCQQASSTLALVATPGCADDALVEDLKAPPLPRTVLAIKEHALPHTGAVFSSLTEAGLAVVGVRLICAHLPGSIPNQRPVAANGAPPERRSRPCALAPHLRRLYASPLRRCLTPLTSARLSLHVAADLATQLGSAAQLGEPSFLRPLHSSKHLDLHTMRARVNLTCERAACPGLKLASAPTTQGWIRRSCQAQF